MGKDSPSLDWKKCGTDNMSSKIEKELRDSFEARS